MKKETPTRLFLYEFCEICMNIFLLEHLQESALVNLR